MSRADPSALAAQPMGPAPAAWITGMLACAAPTLLSWNVSPSATFLNQALAFGLWGWFVLATAAAAGPWQAAWQHGKPLALALLLTMAAVCWTWGPGALPSSLALSLLGALLAGLLVAAHGVSMGTSPLPVEPTRAFAIFCAGWLAAGLAGSAIAAIQVFWPDLPDGNWIAVSGIPGRAVGNLRQPNHLSSVLLWACVALVGLHELRRWSKALTAALGAVLVVAVVLTASRTGLVSVMLLAVWGAFDRRLSRPVRWMLLAAPLLYAAAWWLLAQWGEMSQHRFGGAERLAETDISGSRFGIWANTWSLIKMYPWTGVGMGEFNIAWSLTPFPGRPTAFFDHTHNLPLQLAVEMGLPLATLVMALLLAALWRVARAAWRGPDADSHASLTLRCATLMVAMIGLHSMLEYPLWYAYFLLPALWIWGLALGVAAASSVDAAVVEAASGQLAPARPPGQPVAANSRGQLPLAVAGALMVIGTALSLLDYQRVVLIFSAPDGAAPLEQRIAAGRHSVLFGHHAAYAAATTMQAEGDNLRPFAQASHYLLDTRLMQSWAEALNAAGRVEEARHIAQRLREFRNPASAEFFEVCEVQATLKPWNCEPPRQALDWRSFTR